MARIASLVIALSFALAPAQDQCLSFVNGVDAYVDVPHDASLIPASGITLEAWVTYDGSALAAGWRWPTVARKNIQPGQEAYFLRINAGNNNTRVLRWKIVTNTGSYSADWSFTSGDLLTWVHVAATYDGAAARLFVNGALAAQTSASGVLLDNGGVLRIGKGDGATLEVWSGLIDELRLWPFARSQAEIQAAMGLRMQGIPGGVSSWSFDGTAFESSLGTNSGSLVGATSFVPGTTPTMSLGSLGATNFGAGSSGCSALVQAGVSSPARVGNASFGVSCIGASPAVTGGLAFSDATLSPPASGNGVQLWINPLSSFFYLVPATTGPLGAVTVSLPLPNDPLLVNQQLHAQFAFIDPCGIAGLTTSNGLTLVFQP